METLSFAFGVLSMVGLLFVVAMLPESVNAKVCDDNAAVVR